MLAPKVALESNKASLKVFPVEAVKLCVATNTSCLKELQIADVLAIKFSPHYGDGDLTGILTVPSV